MIQNFKDFLTNTDWKQLLATVEWQELGKQAALYAEEGIDKLKQTVQETLDKFSDVQVVVYRGYGSDKAVYLKGRVLKSKKVTLPTEQDSTLLNMLNMYKRLESDEIPEAVLEIRFQGINTMLISDHEGYFDLELTPNSPMQVLPHTEHFEVRLQNSPIGQVAEPII